MKKLLFILLAVLTAFSSAYSQTRTTTVKNIQQGDFIDFGGTNLVPSDSLQVTDSIAYIIPITHLNSTDLYQTFYWLKSGAGTATLKVNFFQANDPVNFFPIKAGVSQTAYSKTFTLSSSTWNEIDFRRDTATFSGRYLKVQFSTSGTASVKGYLFNRLKTYIK